MLYGLSFNEVATFSSQWGAIAKLIKYVIFVCAHENLEAIAESGNMFLKSVGIFLSIE